MKIRTILILILLVTSKPVFAQEKAQRNEEIIIDVPNGKIENGIYICNRFDWKIEIPAGFETTSRERVEELEKKGYDALKSEVPNGMQIRKSSPHLIGFGVDKRNTFSASFETLEGTKEMTLEEHKDFVATLMSDTYTKIESLKFELNKSDIRIGEHNFYRIQVKLYNAKTGQLLLTQEIYNSFIQKNLFSASINYTTESTGELLTKNFIKSMSN